jgi:hypothetical protein
MRFWILVVCGALVLIGAILPWTTPGPQPTFPAVIVNVPPPQFKSPTPEPPKMIEVIDLSRAYEPVRERDEAINPATFIEVPTQVERIDVMPREIHNLSATVEDYRFFLNGIVPPSPVAGQVNLDPQSVARPEKLDVAPRVLYGGLLNFVPSPDIDRTFVPMGVPYTTDITQPIPPNAVWSIRLVVMPRLLPARFVIEQPDGRLLHYVEVTDGAVVRVPHGDSPADEHFTHPIRRAAFTVPLIPVERLNIEPRLNGIEINREK